MKCRYCGFPISGECQCSRCTSVKASGYCNTNHQNAFYEEMEYEKQRAALANA